MSVQLVPNYKLIETLWCSVPLKAGVVENTQLPSNINEARDSREQEKWKEAMEDELESLDKHKVWHLCERPKNAKIIKSKWIFSKKRNDNKNLKNDENFIKTNTSYFKSFKKMIISFD